MKTIRTILQSAIAVSLVFGAGSLHAQYRDFDASPSPRDNGSYECHCMCDGKTTSVEARIPGECKDSTEGGSCQWQGQIGGIPVTYEGTLSQCESVFVIN